MIWVGANLVFARAGSVELGEHKVRPYKKG